MKKDSRLMPEDEQERRHRNEITKYRELADGRWKWIERLQAENEALRETLGTLLARIWKAANLCPACCAADHQNCRRILSQDNFCSTLGSIHVEYCKCPVCRPSDPT
jgi:hypothetical protein